jgi:class 3 adenylate cyclase
MVIKSSTRSNCAYSLDSGDQSYDDESELSFEEEEAEKQRGNEQIDGDFEDKAVACFRFFILFILVSVMVAAGASTWHFISTDEHGDFLHEVRTNERTKEATHRALRCAILFYFMSHSDLTLWLKQFDIIAEAIVDGSADTVAHVLTDCRTMASTLTALAINSETDWPFFTDPNFHVIASNFRLSSSAERVAIAPIVEVSNRWLWEDYSVEQQGWIEDGIIWQGIPIPDPVDDIPSRMYKRVNGQMVDERGPGPFAPLWETSLAPSDPSVVNFNMLSHPTFSRVFDDVQKSYQPVLSEAVDPTEFYGQAAKVDTPTSVLAYPISSDFEGNHMVGTLIADFTWESFFSVSQRNDDIPHVVVVVDDNCTQVFTFHVHGANVTFAGYGDVHDHQYDQYEEAYRFAPFLKTDHSGGPQCEYTVHVYPSTEFYDEFNTNKPAVIATVVFPVFFVTSIIFCLYDCAVHTRQRRILAIAAQSERILSILYPKSIRDRLFGTSPEYTEKETVSSGDQKEKDKKQRTKSQHDQHKSVKHKLKSFMNEGTEGGKTDNESTGDPFDSRPIADLFPHTTVMFADIAGFTAWSSVREPSQVFTLLETVYRAFDIMAKRRRVFKVETVGDCYVAVTGLPEARKDHALAMARFARDCVQRFNELVGQLETTLGPDTGDLAIRVGLHSGPVTAGVLRGDKSRFQLFGDTVNTAARIETTGKRNKIHLSMETAEELQHAGKAGWLCRREKAVEAKGKGILQTYWLLLKDEATGAASSCGSMCGAEEDTHEHQATTSIPKAIAQDAPNLKAETADELEKSLPPKIQRLVKWNVDVLTRLLKQVVAKRNAMSNRRNHDMMLTKAEADIRKKFMVLDEVVEIIPLPGFNQRIYKRQEDPNSIELPKEVVEQMRLYVGCIAALHRDNHFHNFEHASHVMMSVSKLLSRIVAADDIMCKENEDHANTSGRSSKDFGWSVHDHTYGITSDPMTQFSVVFAALIHDVDHLGVSNFQLVQEDHKLAKLFEAKSVAEQNSIVLAWDTLMDPRFYDLRRTIYVAPFELQRFRQLLANTVLATDIFDKQLQSIRKKRWEVAFSVQPVALAGDIESTRDDINRKATIVIEHLIQASDVAHTMQHWHIYRKWNERLFAEMTVAYQSGRMENNPADGWYHGELGFFDNYIIPLAKKLKDCGVFGVSSDEYLNYALENRREWANQGEDVLAELIAKYQPENKKDEAPRSPPR